jgi:hypothetical protein
MLDAKCASSLVPLPVGRSGACLDFWSCVDARCRKSYSAVVRAQEKWRSAARGLTAARTFDVLDFVAKCS